MLCAVRNAIRSGAAQISQRYQPNKGKRQPRQTDFIGLVNWRTCPIQSLSDTKLNQYQLFAGVAVGRYSLADNFVSNNANVAIPTTELRIAVGAVVTVVAIVVI